MILLDECNQAVSRTSFFNERKPISERPNVHDTNKEMDQLKQLISQCCEK